MNDIPSTLSFTPPTTPDAIQAVEATPLTSRLNYPNTVAALLAQAEKYDAAAAQSFLMSADPAAEPHVTSYTQLIEEGRALANALHAAGVRPGDRIAVLTPNMPETVFAMVAGHMLGAFAPINPMLEGEIIGAILREMEATAVIALGPTPGLDIAEKAATAVAAAPSVKIMLEASLAPYLGAPPSAAPERQIGSARVLDYRAAVAAAPRDRFTFNHPIDNDTVSALFHTGGTTGAPKLAPHRQQAIMAQLGMISASFGHRELPLENRMGFLNALPLFHIFGKYGMCLSPLVNGGHTVLATPAGFRTPGLVENFWKLVERYKIASTGAVPTALSVLAHAEVDADISSLEMMIVGGSILPSPLGRAFVERTGVALCDVYGMTEVTGLVACNPEAGRARIGSVGLVSPYVRVRICAFDADGKYVKDCERDEAGEICVDSPAKFPGYLDASRNDGVFHDGFYRTGDLGRLDAEGALWVTGRAKDIIIRGGHNIDAGVIEDALMAHPDVAFVGAIGQPDAYAGETPCAYVEMAPGKTADPAALKDYAAERVAERAARPVEVLILPALPKTAVGKVYKPTLREMAAERVFKAALDGVGLSAATIEVQQDPKQGMVLAISGVAASEQAAAEQALNGFTTAWRLV